MTELKHSAGLSSADGSLVRTARSILTGIAASIRGIAREPSTNESEPIPPETASPSGNDGQQVTENQSLKAAREELTAQKLANCTLITDLANERRRRISAEKNLDVTVQRLTLSTDLEYQQLLLRQIELARALLKEHGQADMLDAVRQEGVRGEEEVPVLRSMVRAESR